MNVEQLEAGVLCNLRAGWWGASAKYDNEKLGKDVPKDIVRAVQDLLEDKTMIEQIRTEQRKLKGFVLRNSLPCPIDSVYFVPTEKIPEIQDEVDRTTEIIYEMVNELVKNYTKLKNSFQKKYPKQYRPEKYPTPERLRNKFYVECSFFQIGMPDQAVMEIDPERYKKVQERFQGMAEEIEEMAVTMIGNQLMLRLDKLQEQCETGEGIHGRTVGSINRFLETWQDIWSGHVDDKKLKMIMTRLRNQMKKISADRLRDNEEFREVANQKISQIMKNLSRIPNVELKRKLDI